MYHLSSELPEGSYTIQATNGRITESRLFNVDDARIIDIAPTLLQFEPGDVMTFTGTVQPGYVVEVVITDPRDSEVYSEEIEPDLDGRIRIEFATTHYDQEGRTRHLAQTGARVGAMSIIRASSTLNNRDSVIRPFVACIV